MPSEVVPTPPNTEQSLQPARLSKPSLGVAQCCARFRLSRASLSRAQHCTRVRLSKPSLGVAQCCARVKGKKLSEAGRLGRSWCNRDEVLLLTYWSGSLAVAASETFYMG